MSAYDILLAYHDNFAMQGLICCSAAQVYAESEPAIADRLAQRVESSWRRFPSGFGSGCDKTRETLFCPEDRGVLKRRTVVAYAMGA